MKSLLAFIFLLLVQIMAIAQPGGGGDPGGGQPVPIPGLGILAAIGVYLGIRTLRKRNKSN